MSDDRKDEGQLGARPLKGMAQTAATDNLPDSQVPMANLPAHVLVEMIESLVEYKRKREEEDRQKGPWNCLADRNLRNFRDAKEEWPEEAERQAMLEKGAAKADTICAWWKVVEVTFEDNEDDATNWDLQDINLVHGDAEGPDGYRLLQQIPDKDHERGRILRSQGAATHFTDLISPQLLLYRLTSIFGLQMGAREERLDRPLDVVFKIDLRHKDGTGLWLTDCGGFVYGGAIGLPCGIACSLDLLSYIVSDRCAKTSRSGGYGVVGLGDADVDYGSMSE